MNHIVMRVIFIQIKKITHTHTAATFRQIKIELYKAIVFPLFIRAIFLHNIYLLYCPPQKAQKKQSHRTRISHPEPVGVITQITWSIWNIGILFAKRQTICWGHYNVIAICAQTISFLITSSYKIQTKNK